MIGADTRDVRRLRREAGARGLEPGCRLVFFLSPCLVVFFRVRCQCTLLLRSLPSFRDAQVSPRPIRPS